MQITPYANIPSTPGTHVCIFPCRIQQARIGNDGNMLYNQTSKLAAANEDKIRILSVIYKDNGVVDLNCDARTEVQPGMNFMPTRPDAGTTLRKTFQLKLMIPRGSIGKSKVSLLHPSAPLKVDSWPMVDSAGNRVVLTDKELARVKNTIIQQLCAHYMANGKPHLIEGYAPETKLMADLLSEFDRPFRAQNHDYTYPAAALANHIIDMVCGIRRPKVTFQKLFEQGFIPEVPAISVARRLGDNYDYLKETFFVGIYWCGGQVTKNLQTANKLSRVMDEPVTLETLDAAMAAYGDVESTQVRDAKEWPFVIANNHALYCIGVVKTTSRRPRNERPEVA